MGEVRAKATITNALDEALARRGQIPSSRFAAMRQMRSLITEQCVVLFLLT